MAYGWLSASEDGDDDLSNCAVCSGWIGFGNKELKTFSFSSSGWFGSGGVCSCCAIDGAGRLFLIG